LEEKIYWQEQTEYHIEKEIKALKTNIIYIPEELLKGYPPKNKNKENSKIKKHTIWMK
jgi:hypothetical protein